MGAWGHGIRQDDFVCDVIGVFDDLMKAGKSVVDATKDLISRFSAEINDTDDGPLFWIALADAQWTYGGLEPQVLQRVQDDFNSGRGLDRWTEDERAFARRQDAIRKFINKISELNPRPKKPPRFVIRAPKFAPGDCLSIRLESGQYAAALVLAADHSNLEYGKNLIVVLDYLASERPTIPVFGDRKWLVRTHHSWNHAIDLAWYQPVGFRSAKNRIEIVGKIEILDSDPKESNSYCGWAGIGEQVVYQRKWDANLK